MGSCLLGAEIRLWNIPAPRIQHFANYVGSVALNNAQDVVAITLPKGNRVAKFSMGGEKLISTLEIPGSFGVSKKGDGFLATSVFGADFVAAQWRRHPQAFVQHTTFNCFV